MHQILWQLIIVCGMVGVIEAGVKIEISPVRNPVTTSTPSPNMPNMEVNEIETTEATTTVQSTVTETTINPINESNIQKLANSSSNTINSTVEVTTAASLNVTGTLRPAQANNTNNTNTSAVYNNNVTTISAKDLNPYLSEFTRRQMRRRLIPADYYCPCDLKINFCDINCCCDVDCLSGEIIQTLKCNERDWSIYDYEESSELQLCSQTRQFSLFCIVDNTRRRKQTRKRDFMVHDVNILSVVQYKWPNQYDHQAFAKNDYREHYIYGDPLLVWDESAEEIQFLDIPWSFTASNCRIKNAVKHLLDDETNCVQTVEEHDRFISDIQNKLKSVKFLKYRRLLDTPAIIMKDFCMSAQTVNQTENCTDAQIYHCVDTISMRTCKQDTNSTSSMPEFDENFICDELSIQIHHNFTNILNVTVFFVYHEFNVDNPTAHVVQKISLEYLELNETFATRDVHQVSGNIGYLPHKPIIVSKLIRLNESVDVNTKRVGRLLAYFHNETNCTNDDHYLKVPVIESNGDCVINNVTFQSINFGENSRIKCNVILTLTEFNETDSSEQPLSLEQNNTHICRAFQRKIFNHFLHRFELEDVNSTIYNRFTNRVSEMGNPRNNTQYWFEFRTIRPPSFDDIVAASVANGAMEFTCTNMILGVRYEFFYGSMMVGKVSNQALIKAGQIQFGNRVNLKFKLDEDVLKAPIYIDVMFYDFSRSRAPAHTQSLLALLIMLKMCTFLI
ncbi:tectonic-like isoform X1 [Sitodiplosis mosellana]|uniref:tectonic-like isoform X1 n=1 Tax=Sitodiplosis mosellana TaxID=263140 RepID=UPI002444510F|nr:tectonic-like isoform X1 [Sitodiplosis mosellana]